MPRVSVVIPTKNRLSQLKRAVASVLAQSFKDFDLWIVDDGSQDGTSLWVREELATKADAQPIHLISTEQAGVSKARNLAIRQSSSPWIALLDSDDEWCANKLARQWDFLSLHGDLPLIHTDEIWIRNGVRLNPMKKHRKAGGMIFSRCLPMCVISPSASLLQRRRLEDIGLFREDFPVCEDYELWLRIASHYEVGFIDEPLVIKYGGHADQLSRQYPAMDSWRIKALAPFLEATHLTVEQRVEVAHELAKKLRIVIEGCRKHGNRNLLAEMGPYQTSLEVFNNSIQKSGANSLI